MASLQTRDLELVTFNFIRNHYEGKYKQNVPMALKYLTLQFSNRIIGCKLLTIKEDMDFFNLLLTKLPSIRRFNLLFRASDHNYSGKKFHDLCDDKGSTITIIKSNWGNIFGGYTSKSWKPPQSDDAFFTRDENAFLFLIKSDQESIQMKCPLVLELKKYGLLRDYANMAICGDEDYGPIFGAGHDICIYSDPECNKTVEEEPDNNYSKLYSYHNDNLSQLIHPLCGGHVRDEIIERKFLFQVLDYEVFQIV